MANKPVIHGRDHRPGGADPIPGAAGVGIEFDTDNQGGYLFATTNALEPSTGSYGMVLQDDTDGMLLRTLSANSALELEAVTGNISLIAGGTGAAGGINLEAGDIITVESGTDTNFNVGNDIGFYLDNSGGLFTVHDSSAAPIFRVEEDGSVHILTGTSIVADL